MGANKPSYTFEGYRSLIEACESPDELKLIEEFYVKDKDAGHFTTPQLITIKGEITYKAILLQQGKADLTDE